jgi:hypothetical protein
LIRITFCQTNRLFILLERAETEICFSMANGTFKMKIDIDCHGPRLMPNNCQHLDPPYFSLPTIFKNNTGINHSNERRFAVLSLQTEEISLLIIELTCNP